MTITALMLRGRPGPAHAFSAGALEAITSRSPTFYLPLQSASAADVSGNGINGSFIGGTPAVVTGPLGGNALDLAGTIYIEIAHNATHMECPSPSVEKWVGLEGGAGLWSMLPTLSDNAWIAHKAGLDRGVCEMGLYAMADGTAVLRFSQWDGSRSEIKTRPGVIQAGVWFHWHMQMDVHGAWASVNGQKLYDGHSHPHGWRGLHTRVAKAIKLNSRPLQVARNPESGALTDMHVAQFAGWFREPVTVESGAARDLQSHAETLDLADVQAIAGVSGAALPDAVWGRDSTTISSGVQAEVDTMSAAGGGTVFVNAGTLAETFEPKSNVRVVGLGAGVTFTLTSDSHAGSWTTLTDPGGDFVPGSYTFPIGAQVQAGDIVVFQSQFMVSGFWAGTEAVDTALDFDGFQQGFRVIEVSGADAIFDRPLVMPPYFKDPAGAGGYGLHQDERRHRIRRSRGGANHISLENIRFQAVGDPVVDYERVSDLRLVDVVSHQTSTAVDQIAWRLWDFYDVHAIRGGVENDSRDDPGAGNVLAYGLFLHRQSNRISWLDGAFRADGWHAISNGNNTAFADFVRFDADGGSDAFGAGTWQPRLIDCHAGGIFHNYCHGTAEMGCTVSCYGSGVDNVQFTTKNDGCYFMINDGAGESLYRKAHFEATVVEFIRVGSGGTPRWLKNCSFVDCTLAGTPPTGANYRSYQDAGGNVFIRTD